MESFRPSKNHFKNDIGSSYPLQSGSALNPAYFGQPVKISNTCFGKNDTRNSQDDSRTSVRACPFDSIVHLPPVHDHKEQSQNSSDIQLESTKHIYGAKAFSSFPPSTNAFVSATRRLDGQAGPQPSLLSSPNTDRTQMLLTHQLRWSTSADDMSAIRPGCCSQNVCYYNKLDCRIPSHKRSARRRLSRRLLNSSPAQGSTQHTSKHSCTLPVQSGLVCESREIDHQANKVDRISRHQLGHTNKPQVPTTREGKKKSTDPHGHTRSGQLDPQAGATPLRDTQLCVLHHPPGKDALPSAATSHPGTATTSSPSGTADTRRSPRTRVVDGECRSKDSNSHRCATHKLCHHGRFGHSVGCSGQQQQGTGCMATQPEKMALQSQRDVCCDCCVDEGIQSSPGLQDHSTDRQQDSGLVHSEGRRHKITPIDEIDTRIVDSGRRPQCCTDPTPPTRAVQHRSRPLVSKSRRQRVAPAGGSNIKDFPDLGKTGHRLVRVTNRTRCDKLRFPRFLRLQRLLSRRIQQILAIRPRMGVPTAGVAPTSSAPPQLSIRSVHNSSTQVEETLLATRPEESILVTAAEDQRPEEDLGGHGDRPTTSSCQRTAVGSLAHFGWDTMTSDWSPQEKDLLLSCWRPSTLKTYTPIWGKWSLWCRQNNVNFRIPNPTDVAKYLAYLYLNQKLAYRTILVHKSVIASICETASNIRISSSHIVKHILKAISIAKPLPPKVPTWDPRELITYLKENTPDTSSLYEVSKRTATILLLCSGRRVHDLFLLHIDSDHFVDNGDSITLHPVFGSKTDSATFQQSSWVLLTSQNQNTNPLYWLRMLKNLSKERRGSLTNLFITTRDPVRAATPTIIGGWVKRVLSDAGIQASPGSFRSAVSSLNWLENYPINDILSKANWRHESTFRKFYRKEIRSRNEMSSVHSLTSLFQVPN